jgi:hypothetical protein
MVVRLELTLLYDWLRALPDHVYVTVTVGVHQGATYGLAIANLQDVDRPIDTIPVGWPQGTGLQRRQGQSCTSMPASTISSHRWTSMPSSRTEGLRW